MELALMRYKGFTLWCNPLSIEIESKINNVSYTLPYSGEVQEYAGRKCRVISGKGELRGKDCLSQYAKLYALHAEGGKGILSLPTIEPVAALFTRLTALADVTPDRISYSFQFVELSSNENLKTGKIHKVKEGETLFDIAYKYGVSVDSLIKLNPRVRRPDELETFEEIKVC